ncbi:MULTISPECIES: hypothetical protein [unclassified Cryobacterium]|uniref:hypothetical protein n=1 Tax=unclassified Cryobacterium TaxID=2649013 RepID=UPI00106A75C4|nr:MULTISPECIES: hypothetical protein [unclassified Cryobacterium]TFD14197.1 hypothetical protein E3T42_12020 [Cryobacterium sp. TMT4-10]TFD20221.1 hypothetical protein E3T32_09315 [Cryobacterium sp. TMT2-23]
METELAGYLVGYDTDVWIDVPLHFPEQDWATRDDWARDVAERTGREMPEPETTIGRFYETAREIAAFSVPDAAKRFWYFPVAGSFLSVAHLYTASRAELGEASLEDCAGSAESSLTVPVVAEIESDGFGRLVRVLSTTSLEQEDGSNRVVGCARLVGEAAGHVFLLEVIDDNLGRIALMLDDLKALMEAIRIVPAEESQTR